MVLYYFILHCQPLEIAAPCEDEEFCSEIIPECSSDYIKEKCPRYCDACPGRDGEYYKTKRHGLLFNNVSD